VSGPVVTVHPRRMWVLRLGPRAARLLVGAVAITGCAAAARLAISPPRVPAPPPAPVAVADLSQQAFAALFARRYLTWDASNPTLHQQGLAPFTGSETDPDAGVTPPASGSEQVLWTDVVQSQPGPGGEQVYTVAVQTDVAGLQYLAVPVVREPGGRLILGGYPAFVGPPAMGPFHDTSASLPQVSDPGLSVVVTRALRNYLAGATSDLAADLTPDADVSPPVQPLALSDVVALRWSNAGQAVLAQVVADDARGAEYTLTYDIAVTREQARWEVSAIEIDPDA